MENKVALYSALIGGFAVLMVLFLTVWNNGDIDENSDEASPTPAIDVEMGSYSSEDVSLHNSENDCWMIINDGVYNVTDYIKQHPGGKSMVQVCGSDGTELFNTKPYSNKPHSDNATSLAEEYKIGTLE